MANINIYSWDDFLYYTGSTAPMYKKDTQDAFSSSDILHFGDSHLDANDNFIGDGSGTREDPYICGTYYEMRRSTGAPNIYSLQLVENGDDENGYHLYYYPKGNKYARHDRSNTTIDFNEVQPTGVNNIYVNCPINFNGWTFENLNFYPGSRFKFNTKSAYINHMILLKCLTQAASASARYALFDTAYSGSSSSTAYNVSVRDSIIQVDLQHGATSISSSSAAFLLYGSYCDPSLYRCSVAISGRVGSFSIASINSYSNYDSYVYDCNFNMDVSILGTLTDGSPHFYNCKFTGQITNRNNGVVNLGVTGSNCIVDMYSWYKQDGSEPTKHTVEFKSSAPITVVNSDKATPTKTYLLGCDTTTINSPSALRSLGFPIGSDD